MMVSRAADRQGFGSKAREEVGLERRDLQVTLAIALFEVERWLSIAG